MLEVRTTGEIDNVVEEEVRSVASAAGFGDPDAIVFEAGRRCLVWEIQRIDDANDLARRLRAVPGVEVTVAPAK